MRPIVTITRDLDALTFADFDYDNSTSDGWERLAVLCDELRDAAGPAGIPTLFAVAERLDDADLGTPGPLVHTIESWPGLYEDLLAESVRRKPTPLTVWMINRILNREPDDAADWLDLLRSVDAHPLASAETKVVAVNFLDHQATA